MYMDNCKLGTVIVMIIVIITRIICRLKKTA
jgi:hypothetical protein